MISGVALPAIADAPHGGDVRALRAKLSAQLRDVAIDGPIRAVVVVAPDALEQEIAAEGATGVGCEEGKEIELAAGEIELPVAKPDVAAGEIDVEQIGRAHV